MTEPEHDPLLERVDALLRKDRPGQGDDVPVLTEVVEEPGAPRRAAVDRGALEALAQQLERAVLERLGPEVDRLIEEKLAKTLNQVLGSSVSGVRAELTASVQQTVREALAASVAHALSQPKPE